ncbi:MAG: cobalamin B12-binding domain-containing protein [Chloroflexi bacterium]|nr:cobalamin B12-binding domain-containing protein [Chloroflexota bacterium]
MNDKIDLLLVKPGNQQKLYGELSAALSGSLPLSAIEPPVLAAVLAAFIRQHGYSVKMLDAEAENLSPEGTADKIIKYNPLLAAVFISGTNPSASTQNMPGAGAIIRSIKEKAPHIKTLLGGLHPSSLPERTLKEEDADFVCQGEGFDTILQLLAALKSGKTDDLSINGLWYQRDGKVISNPRAPLIKNLDELPMAAWDLLPMEKYRAHNWHCFGHLDQRQPYAVIYTSLGCPFSCSFCCINSIFGQRGIRSRSPENVIEEIDYLVKNYQIKNLKILDELFVINEQHVIGLCDLIIQRGYDLNIWAYSRIDTINEKMLRKMKQAGINWLAYGIESGSKKVRDGVTKGRFGQDDIRKVLKMTRAAGIYIGGNFIFGLPDDDMETMQETLDLAKELNCEYTNLYVAMAYPGSQLYEDAVCNNIKLPDSWLGYAQYSDETYPLATKYLSSADVLRFRDRAFEEFNNSPQYQEMIRQKFGEDTVEHIREMLKRKLHRKLLEEEQVR